MFRYVLLVCISLLVFANSAFAQAVEQGPPGNPSSPWFVTGTVTFDNVSIDISGSLPAGNNNIGDVDIASLPSVTIGTFPDNEPFNLAQVAGTTVSVGVGASGAGTQRTAALIHDGTDTALVSGSGSLQVTCDNCGGASPFEDNDAFTFGTTSITNIGFVFDDASPNAVTENSAAAPRMSSNRVPYAQLRDAAGNERGANVNASNALLTAQTGELPAGTQNIGDVDVASIAAGDNNIGNVDVVTLPSVTIGTFPDNEPINVAQMNGVAVTMGNGASGTGVQRVTIASDTTGVIQVKGQNSVTPIFCTSTAFLNMTTATTTQIVALSGSTHIYVCSYLIHIRSAADVKLVSGTGTNCATSQADISPNYDFDNADVGVNRVAGGGNIVSKTNDAGDAVCVTSSAATDVDVEVSYAQF